MDWVCDKLVHHGWYGGVQDEGDQKEKSKDTNNGQGTEEQRRIIFDLFNAWRRLLRLPHGGVHLGHAGGCCWGWVSLSQSLWPVCQCAGSTPVVVPCQLTTDRCWQHNCAWRWRKLMARIQTSAALVQCNAQCSGAEYWWQRNRAWAHGSWA